MIALTGGAAEAGPLWALDPALPGPDLPPAGRSLFDFATEGGRNVPYPFEKLVARIESRAGCEAGACVKAVLIPLGRSLQRTVAGPDFFAHPRIVAAITGEGRGPLHAKDRLYLAFQDQANLIEVISYNEAAARFEFQLVNDYRAGGAPRVTYAKRMVCLACHQNQAPVFSRQVWQETNANPAVAALLAAKASGAAPSFHGVPVHRGVDVANAIDNATDRANLISVTQRIWREACDLACKRATLTAALQYRLSGERAFAPIAVEDSLRRTFGARWPEGLAIPNSDLPNRDPLAGPQGVAMPALAHVAAPFEALSPRAPLEVWRAGDELLVRRFVLGIAALFAESDIRALDRLLAGTKAAQRTLTAKCAFGPRGDYRCSSGEATLEGRPDALDLIEIAGSEPLRHFAAKGASFGPTSGGLRLRLASGEAVTQVRLETKGKEGTASVTIAADFPAAIERIARMPDTAEPLSRVRVLRALGLTHEASCCEELAGASPPVVAEPPRTDLPPEALQFEQPCAVCHRTAEPFPPNFLTGDAKRVREALAHCAPRIFARLSMWLQSEATRDKVPMPPPVASRAGEPWRQAQPVPAVESLAFAAAQWLRKEMGHAPDVREMLANGYENLRPCLPAGA